MSKVTNPNVKGKTDVVNNDYVQDANAYNQLNEQHKIVMTKDQLQKPKTENNPTLVASNLPIEQKKVFGEKSLSNSNTHANVDSINFQMNSGPNSLF